MINKGYSSRYLAAHNCNTSGFRAAYQFRGLLDSTSYIIVLEVPPRRKFLISCKLKNNKEEVRIRGSETTLALLTLGFNNAVKIDHVKTYKLFEVSRCRRPGY
jgi:hypothetical protein